MTTPIDPFARRREQPDRLLDPRPRIVRVRSIGAAKPEPRVINVVRREEAAVEEATPSRQGEDRPSEAG
jgi:hypothetical protein